MSSNICLSEVIIDVIIEHFIRNTWLFFTLLINVEVGSVYLIFLDGLWVLVYFLVKRKKDFVCVLVTPKVMFLFIDFGRYLPTVI